MPLHDTVLRELEQRGETLQHAIDSTTKTLAQKKADKRKLDEQIKAERQSMVGRFLEDHGVDLADPHALLRAVQLGLPACAAGLDKWGAEILVGVFKMIAQLLDKHAERPAEALVQLQLLQGGKREEQ